MSDPLMPPTGVNFLLLSMGEGVNRLLLEDGNDIIRIVIQYGSEPHSWFYMDEEDVRSVVEFLSEWLSDNETAPQ